nr:hypothetical protein [uncultured Dysosmobacter sp.]
MGLLRLFRRKDTGFDINPFDGRLYMIIALIKDLNKSNFEKLKDTMDTLYEGIEKNKKVKTPDQTIEEVGGFLLHEKDGVVK